LLKALHEKIRINAMAIFHDAPHIHLVEKLGLLKLELGMR